MTAGCCVPYAADAIAAGGGIGPISYGPVGAADGLPGLADPRCTIILVDELTRHFIPDSFRDCPLIEVPRGETAKNLANLALVYDGLLAAGVGRDWTLVAIGGGSITDLGGFAASTWLRGIDFGFVPTTLLAMVDASIGGKNGVNFRDYKNLIGTFNQPRFIRVDTTLLAGLPDADLASGMAEVIKHGIVDGQEHFAAIESAIVAGSLDGGQADSLAGSQAGGQAGQPIGEQSLAPARPDPDDLTRIVALSNALKSHIVVADEREAGQRMRLNLGHTIGHGIETVTGLPHGACVAAGIMAAWGLAGARHPEQATAIRTAVARTANLLARLGLPGSIAAAQAMANRTIPVQTLDASVPDDPRLFRQAIIEAIGADKKKRGGDVLFAMPLDIGRVEIERIPLADLTAWVREAP
jgi:3-dehydroquinate synthase